MHSGNYSLTDNEMKTCVLQIVDMVDHVLIRPLEKKEQLLDEEIQKVNM